MSTNPKYRGIMQPYSKKEGCLCTEIYAKMQKHFPKGKFEVVKDNGKSRRKRRSLLAR
jgi:hypothetical protein